MQGGLRVLDKIEARGFDVLQHRVRIDALDIPRLLWRALRMRRDTATAPLAGRAAQ